MRSSSQSSTASPFFSCLCRAPSGVSLAVVVASAALFLLCPSGEVHGVPFIRGDANSDGHVDVSDARKLTCYLFGGGATPDCMDSTDVNGDANGDFSDVVYLLNWIFLDGPIPPAPSPPTCGSVPHVLGCGVAPPCTPTTLPSSMGLAFQFSAPSAVTGVTGEWALATVTAELLNNTSPALDVDSWSMSIRAKKGKNCRILAATTDGTALSPFLSSGGFEKTTVTRCGKRATSTVALSFVSPVTLPSSATAYDVLRLEVAGKVGSMAKLKFVDGVNCNGQLVANVVTADCGTSYKPALGNTSISFVSGLTNNTPIGTNVRVPLHKNVYVTFDTISGAGLTTATNPSPNFNIVNGGIFRTFHLNTTATGYSNITVSIRYPCGWTTLAKKLATTLWHNGSQVLPTTNDTCANVISGDVTSFSEFSIAIDPDEVEFLRGDANSDGGVDIGDTIFLLGYQFLGTVAPNCPDAGDTNDDGDIDIGDAIYGLAFMFSGGPEPLAPGPVNVGVDPTADSLGGCSYPAPDDEDEDDAADDDFWVSRVF